MTKKNPKISADETAAKLYRKGKAHQIAGEFTEAIEKYELVEARYPFGRYAQQAQLDLTYAYYKQK